MTNDTATRSQSPGLGQEDDVPMVDELVRAHGPIVMTAGRHGSWSTCMCGWTGSTWTTAGGASMEWAEHVAAAEREERANA
jgi:hypothetical protein